MSFYWFPSYLLKEVEALDQNHPDLLLHVLIQKKLLTRQNLKTNKLLLYNGDCSSQQFVDFQFTQFMGKSKGTSKDKLVELLMHMKEIMKQICAYLIKTKEITQSIGS